MTDWPLALCDAQTVDMDRDFVATDVVARDGFTENYQVYFNPEHKWYYLNKQLPSEVIIFRQTDTEKRFATGMSSPKGRPNQMETDSHQVCLMQDFGILCLYRTKSPEKAWRLEPSFTTEAKILSLANYVLDRRESRTYLDTGTVINHVAVAASSRTK